MHLTVMRHDLGNYPWTASPSSDVHRLSQSIRCDCQEFYNLRASINDIKDVRESYEQLKISNVGFVRSEHNPRDDFTKPKSFSF